MRPAVWCLHKRKLSPPVLFQLSSTWFPFVSFRRRNRAHVLHIRDVIYFRSLLYNVDDFVRQAFIFIPAILPAAIHQLIGTFTDIFRSIYIAMAPTAPQSPGYSYVMGFPKVSSLRAIYFTVNSPRSYRHTLYIINYLMKK